MANFDEFISLLENEVKTLAKANLEGFTQEALQDSKLFMTQAQEDLERWLLFLNRGELSPEDFQWLVLSKKHLAKMQTLKQKGLTHAKIDQFTHALLGSIVETAFTLFLPFKPS